MKSIWEGTISLGLVSVPIKIYPAVESRIIGFKLLCKKCHSQIHYKRYCPQCGEEVGWEDIVKGFEVAKGEYYTFTQKELESFKPEKSTVLEIIKFIEKEKIPTIFFNKHYFIAPSRAKDKAYFLLKEALEKTGKIAIGRIILKEKEYIVAIQPYKKGLLLTTLNYLYEIRDINQIETLGEKAKISEKELALAKELIEKYTEKELAMQKYKDEFSEKFKEAVKRKTKEKKGIVVAVKKVKRTRNLIKALELSIKKKKK